MKFLRLLVSVCSVALILHIQSCAPDPDPVTPKATHLYFSDYSGKRVGVVDLNTLGSATTLADESDGLDTISGISVDFLGGRLYAVEELNNRIIRINIDGTGTPEVLYEEGDGVDEPTAIAVDNTTNSLYWANSGSGQIKKGTMDGTGAIDTLYEGDEVISYCYGLVVEPTSKVLFFTDLGEFSGVWSSSIDGTLLGRIGFPSFSTQNPSGIYYDAKTGRLYWADEGWGQVCSGSPFNGSANIIFNSEDGIDQADGVAIDTGSGLVYWTEPDKKTIMRGNIDGTGTPEVVLTGVESYSIMLKFDNQ